MAASEPNGRAPRCPSCGAVGGDAWTTAIDAEYCTTADTFAYLRCPACNVLYIDPIPESRLSEIYPSNYYSFRAPAQSFATRVKDALDARLWKRLLRSLPGDSLRLLDVGGGAGWQLSGVKRLDPRVQFTQVVDLDPAAAEQARSNGHAYHCGRVEDFETDQRFDLILMLNLIEHVSAPGDVLAKMRELLSPNGILLLKTPNYDAWDARIFRHTNWAGYHCPRHWVLFTRPSLEALVEKKGLQVRSFSYTQGAPFWAASFLGWLARRGLVSITRERPAVYHPAFGLLSMLFAALDFARMPFAKTSQMVLALGRAER
jgi:2-polyprenyl-3-methyl-5-hydroxy-6-metoxy-1,4-benzoquinol methylase